MFDTDTLTNSEYHRHAKEIEAAEDEWEVERAHENAAERTLDAIKLWGMTRSAIQRRPRMLANRKPRGMDCTEGW